MKVTLIIIAIFASLVLVGCSKDAEVNAFVAELNGTTEELVRKIDADPSASGIDAAQNAFDERRPQLANKWKEIWNATGIQVSADTKKKLEESVKMNMKALTDASLRNMRAMIRDRDAAQKYQKLMSDFGQTFQ